MGVQYDLLEECGLLGDGLFVEDFRDCWFRRSWTRVIIELPKWLLQRSEKAMLKALLCKLNIQHDWHVEHAEDGSLYSRCRRCGKDDDERGKGIGGEFSGWAGPVGGGGFG